MTVEQVALYLGLAVPLALALWLARGVDGAGRVSPLPLRLGLVTPPVLLLLPFFTATTSSNADLNGVEVRLTYLLTAGVGLTFAALSLCLHARESRRRAGPRLAPLAALLVALSAVHSFGIFLLARLSVVGDPAGGIATAVLRSPSSYALRLVAPCLALGLVVLATGGAPRLVARAQLLLDRGLGRQARALPGATGWPRTRRVAAGLGGLALLLMLLPLVPVVGQPENGAYLAVRGGVRTPEVGLYVLVLALALLAATERSVPRRTGPWSLRVLTTTAGRWRVGLVGAAVAISMARSDLGAVIALVAAFVAMRIAVYRGVDGDRLRSAGLAPDLGSHPIARYWRTWVPGVFVAVLLVLVGSVAVGKTDRLETWLDPWRHPLAPAASPCESVSTLPEVSPGDLFPAAEVPDGVVACVRFGDEQPAAPSTQVAMSQLAVESGGLWGTTIADTYSGIVPVSESDFVVAAIWSKGGGLSVALLLGLFCVAAGALGRYVERRPRPWRERTALDRATILGAAGVGAVMLWQPVVVVASTLGLLPHSGVPVPLVSEGLWSAGSLVVAIGGVLVLAHWTLPAEEVVAPGPHHPQPTRAPARRTPYRWLRAAPASSLGAFTVVIALVCWGLAFPLTALVSSRTHFLDTSRGWRVPGVRELADGAAPDRLLIEGEPAYERRHGSWSPLSGAPGPELLQEFVTAYGNGQGLVDDELAAAPLGPVRSLADRLVPPRPQVARGSDLTVDVALQTVLREETREPVDGVRFATGVSVLDPTTGRVLGLGSAPELSDADAGGLDASVDALNAGEAERTGSDGYRSLTTGDATCSGHDCVQVTWAPDPDRLWTRGTLPSYVGLPPTEGTLQQNRAVEQYGAGSIFKIVIASAYLRAGGRLSDLRESPAEAVVDGRVIDNVYDGQCPGTVDGLLTVAQALAVSCNTTFVLLAEELGWPAVADQAERFGLTVVGRPTARCSLPGLSSVPASADDGIANLALGGGDLTVSPLAMAMVVGTIANDGLRVLPHAMTSAGQHPERCRQRALGAGAAAELRAALRLTATDGSLVGVAAPGAPPLYGKTGTHVMSARLGTGSIDHTLWVVGFVDTGHGPVAFAVAAQSVGTDPGRTHVRSLVGHLIEEIA